MHDSITEEAMTHDPLCLASDRPTAWEPEMCICDVIAKVRENEHTAREEDGPWFRSVVHGCCEEKQTAYADGQRDMLAKCIAAVERLLGPEDEPLRWLLDRETILAALRALQEKP